MFQRIFLFDLFLTKYSFPCVLPFCFYRTRDNEFDNWGTYQYPRITCHKNPNWLHLKDLIDPPCVWRRLRRRRGLWWGSRRSTTRCRLGGTGTGCPEIPLSASVCWQPSRSEVIFRSTPIETDILVPLDYELIKHFPIYVSLNKKKCKQKNQERR